MSREDLADRRSDLRFPYEGVSYHVTRWEGRAGRRPLLLVHGFAQSSESWEDVAYLLVTRGMGSVYAVDLVGHGRTDRPEDADRYRLTAQGAALAAMIESIAKREHVDKVGVVGYSMGGRVVLAAAAARLAKFARLVDVLVLESVGLGPDTDEKRQVDRVHDRQRAVRLRAAGIESFMDYWEKLPLFDTQRALSGRVRADVRAARLRNDAEALARTFEHAGQHAMPSRDDTLRTLAHLVRDGVRVYYLAGGRDQKYRALGRSLVDLPDAPTVRLVPTAGHNIHLEEPIGYANALRTLLA